MSFNDNGKTTPPIDPPANSAQASGFRCLPIKLTMTGEPKAIRVAIYFDEQIGLDEQQRMEPPDREALPERYRHQGFKSSHRGGRAIDFGGLMSSNWAADGSSAGAQGFVSPASPVP